jgi:hypothetical protein
VAEKYASDAIDGFGWASAQSYLADAHRERGLIETKECYVDRARTDLNSAQDLYNKFSRKLAGCIDDDLKKLEPPSCGNSSH